MIPFTKAHACGNDFLIVTEEAASGHDLAALTRRLCHRNTGVGADGIEFFAWTNKPGPGRRSGRIRLHNADGSVAEISGNGTRCVAAWMADSNSVRNPATSLRSQPTRASASAASTSSIIDDDFTVEVTTGMGVPRLAPRTVQLADGIKIKSIEVSTGNPHFIVEVNNPEFTTAGKILAGDWRRDLRSSRFSQPDQRGVCTRRKPKRD